MIIIGISAFYHDSACALIRNGRIICAIQEERITRKKNDNSFPINALIECLNYSNVMSKDIDYIVFYEKPFLKFDRIIECHIKEVPFGLQSFLSSMPLWMSKKIFMKSLIEKEFKKHLSKKINWKEKILFSEHHLSHAASAFFPSPFDKAAIVTIDGVGEWTTTSIYKGKKNQIEPLEEMKFPFSLGLLYSAFTFFCGFKINSGEYKLMGLAPYGKPRFVKIIEENIVKINSDGNFELNMDYFSFHRKNYMINNKFFKLFNCKPREPESKIDAIYMDIAASIQKVTEKIYLNIILKAKKITQEENLCLAGGVALNCVANGYLYNKKIFKNIWVQPAAGDAGSAIGAALSFYHLGLKKPNTNLRNDSDKMQNSLLGQSFKKENYLNALRKEKLPYNYYNDKDLFDVIAQDLINQKIIGWFQGRMEFGPRALGNRSIIADPRSKEMQNELNLKIKFRESFRPFAPIVLEEVFNDWFDGKKSKYMSFVSNVKRNNVHAVTHIDSTSRVQTISKNDKRKIRRLIEIFYKKTDIPMLINTSFNIRGEPIVYSPYDAIKCFKKTNMDVLVLGNFYIKK